jgi:tetratricopeptide (TPR) repeat protein
MHLTSAFAWGLLVAVATGPMQGTSDPRLAPITKEQLVAEIARTPLASAEHEVLLSRAVASRLAGEAYEQYSRLWKARKDDPRANLLRGEAAIAWLEEGPIVAGQRSPVPAEKTEELTQAARTCLTRAVEGDPKSPMAARCYGFFLWQYDRQMTKGLELVKKAASLEPPPGDPTTHLVLGYMYFNPSATTYDRGKAEKELLLAARLDPKYASPHRLLAGLYRDLRRPRPKDSERERQLYLSLIPPGAERRTTWLNHH